ncbi:hypothetical protein K8I28_00450 [bacterium]|nr:hypothetical protein [bacterium]
MKYLAGVFIFLMTASIVMAAVPFWTEGGRWRMSVLSDSRMVNLLEEPAEYYKAEYGVIPSDILFAPNSVNSMPVEVSFIWVTKERGYSGTPPKDMVWKDINPYFFWEISNDDTVFYTEMNTFADTMSVIGKVATKYQIEIEGVVDLWTLPITYDTTMWKVAATLFSDSSSSGSPFHRSNYRNVVYRPVNSAIDSLAWTYYFSYGVPEKSKLLNLWEKFPNNITIISGLFRYYYEESNCDSAKLFGRKLYIYYEQDPPEQTTIDKSFNEWLPEALENICD